MGPGQAEDPDPVVGRDRVAAPGQAVAQAPGMDPARDVGREILRSVRLG